MVSRARMVSQAKMRSRLSSRSKTDTGSSHTTTVTLGNRSEKPQERTVRTDILLSYLQDRTATASGTGLWTENG